MRNKYVAVALAAYLVTELAVLLWIYLTPSISREFVLDPGRACGLIMVAAVSLPGPASVNSIPLLHRMFTSSIPYMCVTLLIASNLQYALFRLPVACKST